MPTFMGGSGRGGTSEDAVLTRICAQLRTYLSLPTAAVYETLDPDETPEIPRGGNYALSVAVGTGAFDENLQIGAGINQIEEQVVVQVTAYVLLNLDPRDKATQLFHAVNRGLMPVLDQVLGALAGHDLLDAGGNPLCTAYVRAMGKSKPRYDDQAGMGIRGLLFRVKFAREFAS